MNKGKVNYEITSICDNPSSESFNVSITDQNGTLVGSSLEAKDSIIIKNPKLWWPRYFGPSKSYGYMYTFNVCALNHC